MVLGNKIDQNVLYLDDATVQNSVKSFIISCHICMYDLIID